MYDRFQQSKTATSWTPSGPDISIECSIPTSPSLYEREQMYATMHERSWPQSPDSFYTFPPPSPDYSKIGNLYANSKWFRFSFWSVSSSRSSQCQTFRLLSGPIHTPLCIAADADGKPAATSRFRVVAGTRIRSVL